MGDERRRTIRQSCLFPAQLRARGRNYSGHVLDLSDEGMCVRTDETPELWVGDKVEVAGNAFGLIPGIVRWCAAGRMGIRFEDCTNTQAKVEALKKQFYLLD